jgi:hypothetical protein
VRLKDFVAGDPRFNNEGHGGAVQRAGSMRPNHRELHILGHGGVPNR